MADRDQNERGETQNTETDEEIAAQYHACATALLAAIDAALAPWTIATLTRFGLAEHPDRDAIIQSVRTEALRPLETLLFTDIDEQRRTPLQILRSAAAPMTDAVGAAGIAPARSGRPEDPFEIGPLTWSDLGEDVMTCGMTWGAAKAYIHLRRHRDIPK